jgi:hypothetical protein
MAEDWRVTVDLDDGHDLAKELDEHELAEEARDALTQRRVAVSGEGSQLFLYADTRETAEQAMEIVRGLVDHAGATARLTLDRWHPVAEEWKPADEPLPETADQIEEENEEREEQDEADSEASGYAEWEVRLDLPSHGAAVDLADKLEAEGIPVTRRWKYLLVGAEDEDDANDLVKRFETEAPPGTRTVIQPGGEMVWEGAPKRSKLFFFIPNM